MKQITSYGNEQLNNDFRARQQFNDYYFREVDLCYPQY